MSSDTSAPDSITAFACRPSGVPALTAPRNSSPAHTPGAAFGSCRYKLKAPEVDRAPYQRLIDVFRAHDVRWFLYNGGNDSADTALKLSKIATEFGYPLACIGVPKTVDNDLD